ncbi:hypothetical protein MMC25_004777 [Agyrium rufum]|nr:hypothetical protein [Agyrium rufum]
MAPLKGPGEAQKHDGSSLRIAIIHARWNTTIISALVSGARSALLAASVKEANIIVQDVPGSYELPYAVGEVIHASRRQGGVTMGSGAVSAADLLGSIGSDLTSGTLTSLPPSQPNSLHGEDGTLKTPFDAVIAIGVLIKGETMHFEYIADAVSHGLMRVQMDQGVPVIFGLLTVLTEEQGLARAGLTEKGHNHGEDWGNAAVELGVKRKIWAEAKMA